MKRSLLILCALLIAAPKANAFEPLPKNNIGIHYSTITGPEYMEGNMSIISAIFDGIINALFKSDNKTEFVHHNSGMFTAEYHRTVGKRIQLGGALGFEHTKVDQLNNGVTTSTTTTNWLSLLPSMKLYYMNRNHFGMYGKVQAGILLDFANVDGTTDSDKKKTGIAPAFQLVPLGLDFGTETLRCYGELGIFSTQGLFAIGIRKSF